MSALEVLCVAMSDVHMGLSTKVLAEKSLRQGIEKAAELKVPFFISGDLHDTKAIFRGECALILITVLKYAASLGVKVYILIGNHDKINEKSEGHSLEFLRPYATIIDKPTPVKLSGKFVYAIPYQSTCEAFLEALSDVTHGSIVFMHQGVRGAFMGEYAVDKSQVTVEALAPYTCISGHYHRHQTLGTLTYIGSPYSVTYAEAKDGPKGFQVVYKDGSMKQVPTNLRKHVIEEVDLEGLEILIHTAAHPNPEDLFWLKVTGPYSELQKLDKKALGASLIGHQNFRLDPIPTEDGQVQAKLEKLSDDQILDKIIDDSEETAKQKKYLKTLWREVME